MFSKTELRTMLQEDKKEGPINYGDMLQKVMDVANKIPELEKACKSLDYALPESLGRDNNWQIISPNISIDDCSVDVFVNTGSSEGMYLDCYLVTEDNEKKSFATLKTLDEGLEAHMNMGQLAGAIMYLGDWYLCANCRLIKERNTPPEQKTKPKSRSI